MMRGAARDQPTVNAEEGLAIFASLLFLFGRLRCRHYPNSRCGLVEHLAQ